ncbi:MAG TPA: SPOR domain-containing protein, partial [Terriglobales bacterium]|nr:SPOR domain-containing protein [Terriglobales bacterium]
KRFFFVRRQLVVLTATFALSLAVVFYLGILTGENLRKKPSGHLENSGVEVTGAAPAQELASMAGSSESPVVSPAATELEPVEAKSTPLAELQVPTATEPKENPAPAPAAAKKAIATTSPAELARVEASKQAAVVKPVSRSDSGAEGGKTWSVQVGASPAKKAIEDQVARLKAKGYESYIVEVERNGQTLYRARVGRFGARAEAETLRQTLESQDGLKSAFIISSDEARPAPAAPSESNSASQ